jgi:hypothetical protein
MIKKTLFIVVVAIAVAAVGVLSVDHYQKYQNKHTPVATVTVAQRNADVAAVKQAAGGEYASLQASYTSLQAECEKGLAAYNALPVASKAKAPQPQCAPAVTR